ncbi:MAG TPA: GcrA family cell cycle regulator [Caulobacteraceae bacterium]|jgi:hypothetical protein|nr:GcrA family cell cycle regulator [Caulobacteraceae bacterium]
MSDEATPSAWTPVRVALLRLHHTLGLSAAASAELIGGMSRNAVISKRRRLGLIGATSRQAAPRISPCGGRPTRVPSLAYLFWRSYETRHGFSRDPLPCMDAPAPPCADPKILADRGERECAWPLGPAETAGDYRTLFCCAPVERGRSFCAAHLARAYRSEEEDEADG